MSRNFVRLFSSKVALAAMGGLLLAGGAATVAFAAPGQSAAPTALFSSAHTAANHGHGNTQSNNGNHGNNQGNGASKGHTPTDHPETVAIQGTLTQYDATHTTITVMGKAEDNDSHGKDHHDGDGANGSANACTLTSPFTITLGASTKINGQAKVAGDLANELGHKVEVQAQEGSNCTLLANKVTVAAADARSNTKSHTFVGTVGTVGASSFTLTPKHGAAMTVNVTPTTTFGGHHVHQLSDLKPGMHVVVHGTLSTGNMVQASRINASGHGHLN